LRIFEITAPAPGERRVLTQIPTQLEAEWQRVNAEISRIIAEVNNLYRAPGSQETFDKIDNLLKQIDVLHRSRLVLRNQLATQTNQTPEIQKIWSEIEQKCSRHLELYRELEFSESFFSCLYRGIKTTVGVIHSHSPLTRRPKDSVSFVSAAYDYALESEGIQARRRNSIFASSNLDFAKEYGEAYIIFPVDNNSSYSWTGVRDLVLDTTELNQMLSQSTVEEYRESLRQITENMSLPVEVRTEANQLLIAAGVTLFENLYQQGPDQIPGLHLPWQKLVDTKKVIRFYGVQDDNLDDAILSGHEVLISGEYYAISNLFYGNFVKQQMGWKY